MLRRHTLCGSQLELIGEVWHEQAGTPLRHLPLKQVLVPLAHLEAMALALWLVRLRAVGVVGGPAFCMNAPHHPGLGPTRATFLPQAATPLAYHTDRQPAKRLHGNHGT